MSRDRNRIGIFLLTKEVYMIKFNPPQRRIIQMLVNQQQALVDLDPHVDTIHSMVSSAVRLYESLPAGVKLLFTQRTKASSIHDFFFGEAVRFCENRADARVHVQNQMRLLVLDERYVFRFKLVDEDDLPRNQLTAQVRDFRGQQDIEGLGTFYHLEIGYGLSEIGQLDRVLLVCPSSAKANAWVSKIVGGEQKPVVVPLFPDAPEPQETKVRGKYDIEKPESEPGDADPGA